MVYSSCELVRSLEIHRQIADDANCELLYSVKACALPFVLDTICHHVDGLSASSLFEARLARSRLGQRGSVHVFQVAMKPGEMEQIRRQADYVSLNSLTQFEQFGRTPPTISRGLRLNPELSFVSDERYDPCRRRSRLGVSLADFDGLIRSDPNSVTALDGVHVHTNCDSRDLEELLRTVQRIEPHLRPLRGRLRWVNLGGGYLLDEAPSLELLHVASALIRESLGVRVLLEPGGSIVRKAGSLVATVVDIVSNDGSDIAVLDTSVNHMPEVFEYQYEPDVLNSVDHGEFSYVLAGSTCLAGDLFGEYGFDEPLRVGSRVVFQNVGAYTTVKWQRFNGLNVPSIYEADESGRLKLQKHFDYASFLSFVSGKESRC